MRRALVLCCVIGGLAACAGEPPPNPYPDAARNAFYDMCGGGQAYCDCSWDGITRAMTAEEWDAAQAALAETGHPHPQIVIVSSRCREETRA